MHVAPAFSCLEIVDKIYHELMKDGDTFIMSKGHGAMAQYVILEDKGLISLDDYGSGIGCHPDLGIPGIACATGSLGHGLGMSVGIAYADPAHCVYVLLSDGEMQEGSTWEALLVANNLMIPNLHIHVDFNGWNSSQEIFHYRCLGNLHEALMRFNFLKIQVHRTTKGHPISFMMNNPLFHYRSPSPEEYQKAMAELA
jgi:transketolase